MQRRTKSFALTGFVGGICPALGSLPCFAFSVPVDCVSYLFLGLVAKGFRKGIIVFMFTRIPGIKDAFVFFVVSIRWPTPLALFSDFDFVRLDFPLGLQAF